MSTLAANDRISGPFVAAAAQTDFPADFPLIVRSGVPDASGVRFQYELAGVITTLDATSFSIVGVVDGGFTVRLNAGLAGGESCFVYGQIVPSRVVAHQPGGGVRTPTLEEDADTITALIQEMRRDIDGAIAFPRGEAGFRIPAKAQRKGLFLGFSAITGALALFAGVVSTPVSAFAATVLAAVDANAAQQIFGTFPTLAAASAAVVPPALTRITLKGYWAAGDCPAFDLVRSTGPAAPGKRQFADSSWWLIDTNDPTTRTFGARGDNNAVSTQAQERLALQEAFDYCFGTIAAPHASSNPQLNKPLRIMRGIYGVDQPVAHAPVRSAKIVGDGQMATQIINKAGGGALVSNGIQYSELRGFRLTSSGTTAVVWDLNWDHIVDASTQANSIYDVFVDGGATGIAIGAGGYQASEMRFYGVTVGPCAQYGITVNNFNALNNQMWGGEIKGCPIGVRMFSGTISLFAPAMQNGVNTFDVQVDNQAADGLCFHGIRSESDNFLNLGNNISASIKGCSHLGANNGVFLTGSCMVTVSACTSVKGVLGNSPVGLFSSCQFYRADFLSASALNYHSLRFINVRYNYVDPPNAILIVDQLHYSKSVHGPTYAPAFICQLPLVAGGGTAQMDVPAGARVIKVTKAVDTVGAAGTVTVGDGGLANRYLAAADLTTANADSAYANLPYLYAADGVITATTTGAAGVVGAIVVHMVMPNGASHS